MASKKFSQKLGADKGKVKADFPGIDLDSKMESGAHTPYKGYDIHDVKHGSNAFAPKKMKGKK